MNNPKDFKRMARVMDELLDEMSRSTHPVGAKNVCQEGRRTSRIERGINAFSTVARWPNTFIIGAMKAGTTALYAALDQHPDVFMSPLKEPNFFAFATDPPDFQAPIERQPGGINHASITDPVAYRQLFAGATTETIVGEASHWSLYWPPAPDNIKQYVPGARIIAILRHPVERAYSEYLHFVRDGHEPLDFMEALDAEPERIERRWAMGRYVDRGFYSEQLRRYTERFSDNQLHVILHDDLVHNMDGVMHRLFEFLGVDPSFEPNLDRRINKSGVPKRQWLHNLLMVLQPIHEVMRPLVPEPLVDRVLVLKNRNLEKPPMPVEARERLMQTYRDDIRNLEQLIERDLSAWLE